MRTNEIQNEIEQIKKWEEKIKTKDLERETKKKCKYDFKQYGAIRSFMKVFIFVKLK